ncbi:DinB family protein [Flavobacterium sp. UBA6135]|uniref:DinB family protein n=1 Tax=Flavobacterium sp. UBA6135 TaxID=1946553 RepID=UPI0025B82F69|nr:DinB family protein [Flavobacterium sp. UBA6135]
MTKQELINVFYDNHKEMSDFINSLTNDQFVYGQNDKWTAGQQFSHVYLTLLPFPKVLPSKEFIIQKFGKINRPTWDYETVLKNYFKTSLQAPQQFLPEQVNPEQKASITAELQKIVLTIQQLLEQYTEEELDTLVLPHPLLGNMTIREMFYLMTYHATHHLRQTEKNLEQLTK